MVVRKELLMVEKMVDLKVLRTVGQKVLLMERWKAGR